MGRGGVSRAQVDTTVAAAVGGGVLPYHEVNGKSTINTLAAWPAANTGYGWRFRLGRRTRVDAILFPVGVTSGNVDAGLYTSADVGVTQTRIASSGSVAAGAANTSQALTLTAPVWLEAGTDYWVWFAVDNITLTLPRTTIHAAHVYGGMIMTKATSFPLPASIATASASTVLAWPVLREG